MYLNHFMLTQQILSGLVVSIVYWTIWVVGSNPTLFHVNFFPLKLKRLAHFRLKVSSNCDLKAETVLPCVNFMRGERGYGIWDLMLTWSNKSRKRCYNHEQKKEIPIAANFVVWFLFCHIFFNVVTYFVFQSAAMYGAF